MNHKACYEWPNCACKTEKGEPCKYEDPDFYLQKERKSLATAASTLTTSSDKVAGPKVTTLCGSTRFPEAFALANMHLTLLGRIVVGLGCYGHADEPTGSQFLTSDGMESSPIKQKLDQLHFRKIDISDGIYVVNVGGYIGASTRREIDYATRTGKTVEYMFPLEA